jgi:hypothetical protein
MPGQAETAVLPHLAFALELSLGIVFLLSALPKFRQPLAFAQGVVGYKILPAGVARVFALALIPLEAFLALTFLTGWLTGIALLLAMITLLAFLFGVGINLRRGRRIPCGCFGETSEPISLRTLARLFMLLAAVLLLATYRTTGEPWPGLGLLVTNASAASALVYLLHTVSLAASLVLLGAWLLSLPELAVMLRSLRWHPATGNTEDKMGMGGA